MTLLNFEPRRENIKPPKFMMFCVVTLENIITQFDSEYFNLIRLNVHEAVHRDTTMKITNKMHYID